MKKIKIILSSTIALIFTIFMFFSFNSSAKTFNDSDKTKYNCNWDYGEVKHWTYGMPVYESKFFGFKKELIEYRVYNFIRIEDKNGKLIDSSKITHLVAKYEINGKKNVYECDSIKLNLEGHSNLKKDDLNGYLFYYEDGVLDDLTVNNRNSGKVKNLFKDEKYSYESTNLCWYWEFTKETQVIDIMEMYVWYMNEKVEEAVSFES